MLWEIERRFVLITSTHCLEMHVFSGVTQNRCFTSQQIYTKFCWQWHGCVPYIKCDGNKYTIPLLILGNITFLHQKLNIMDKHEIYVTLIFHKNRGLFIAFISTVHTIMQGLAHECQTYWGRSGTKVHQGKLLYKAKQVV